MADKWLLIRGGNVIDGSGRAPVPSADVVIRDNRIVAVGDDKLPEEIPPVERMEIIDASGLTVMPGLIDVHCHMTYGEPRTEEENDQYTSHELKTLIAAANMEKVLRAGFTSISAPGGSYYIDVGLREGMRRGLVKGPRITAGGRYLTTSNGLTDWYPTSVGVPEGSIGILTNTVDEMKVEIRRQVKNGVDLIKIADSPYGQYQAFTDDELKCIADLTHQLGKKCTIHARGSAETNAAANAGFDWIMHGNIMTDEVIENLASSQIPLVPVLTFLANRADWPALTGTPERMVAPTRRVLERTADSLHRAHKAGVRFAMGSDTGFSVTPYGEWHARELELMTTYAGLSPLEAITACTKNGAIMLGLAGQLGELKPGYLADVITVKGDPSRNLRVLMNKRNIVDIIKDGERVSFSEDLDGKRFQVDRLPFVYSNVELTYDMVFEGDTTPAYTAVPWSPLEAQELAGAIASAQRGAASETAPTSP